MNTKWCLTRSINMCSSDNDNGFVKRIFDIHNLSVLASDNDIIDIYEKFQESCVKKKVRNDDIFNRDILSKLDDTDPIPSNLIKIFDKYDMTDYFKIGVKKNLDSFFHSFILII